jgi:Domain of unknown function (DUF1735).
MKRILLICISAITLILTYSCNDGLSEELFKKTVLLTNNGWIDQSMTITDSGIIEVPLVLSINGTSGNEKTVTVGVTFDSDTLYDYNFEKYRAQTGLYYIQVPTDAVSFADSVLTIPAGDNSVVSKLYFDLNKVTNKYADYVIPVAIKSASAYSVANGKYGKALLHVKLNNSFSGDYSGDIIVYKTNANTTGKNNGYTTDASNALSVGSKSFYAISSNKCYFFAGKMGRTDDDRSKYIVNMSILKNVAGGDSIVLDSPNPDLNLIQESGAKIDISSVPFENDNRYKTVTTMITLNYLFRDLASTSTTKSMLRAQGTVSMTQKVLK